MVNEVCSFLSGSGEKREVLLDCTVGGGGHALALLSSSPNLFLIGIDRDPKAIEESTKSLTEFKERIELHCARFSQVKKILKDRKVNKVLVDLGTRREQIFSEKGFSFRDQELDMRMDPDTKLTAEEVVNKSSCEELIKIFQEGGVRRYLKKVARAIEDARPIKSAKHLAQVIERAIPVKERVKKPYIHPATVYFQAIRIYINQELEELKALLEVLPLVVADGAIVCIISYHSLEDKLVASTFRYWAHPQREPALLSFKKPAQQPLGTLLTKKPLKSSKEEIDKNFSARSARLRVFKFKE